ncbi:MAG: metallophosphoesterase family protein [Pseudomonadota bacterium]
MPLLDDAKTPRGLRLYAIGDVHGCLDELLAVHDEIRRDLEAYPATDWRIIHLGDYVDRGPDSRGVIETLVATVRDRRTYALLGNHDQYFIDFLRDPGTPNFDHWLGLGGVETIVSYEGWFDPRLRDDLAARRTLREHLLEALPTTHIRFLSTLPHLLHFGDFTFVHAGVRPGVPLDRQSEHDLIWIREPFLTSTVDLGAVIVHGHTPADRIDVRPNRIGVDTGAVFGGPLSCLVLEGQERFALTHRGRELLEDVG